jgi:AraC-like DNA-binding protein
MARLSDALVARALRIASLARTAGLSRAAFSARFTALVGEPAMQYLLGRRMRYAMTLLPDEQNSLARVAERVGYGSEAALSAAFKRYTGVSPGTYRRPKTRGLDR